MKTYFKKIIALLLVSIVSLTLIACSSGASNENAGTYVGQYSKFVGDPDTEKSTDSFTIILNDDGTGTFKRDDNEFKISKWSVKETKFTMKEKFLGAENEYQGTLNGDTLTIYNGEVDNDLTYMYVAKKK